MISLGDHSMVQARLKLSSLAEKESCNYVSITIFAYNLIN